MINLNPRLKRKILRILKEEYKKSLGEYYVDDVDGDFEDIHNLGDGLSINKIHLTQIIMELFGADVTAYNYAVKRFIDDSEEFELREEENFHLEHANIFEEYPSFDPASFDRTRKDLQGPENKQL